MLSGTFRGDRDARVPLAFRQCSSAVTCSTRLGGNVSASVDQERRQPVYVDRLKTGARAASTRSGGGAASNSKRRPTDTGAARGRAGSRQATSHRDKLGGDLGVDHCRVGGRDVESVLAPIRLVRMEREMVGWPRIAVHVLS